MNSTRNLVLIGIAAAALAFTMVNQGSQPTDSADPAAETDGETTETQQEASEEAEEETVDDATRLQRIEQQQLVTIETDEFSASFSNLNTGLVSYLLKEEKYKDKDGDPINMVTTDQEAYFAFQLLLPGVPMPADAIWEAEQLTERSVRFTWQGNGFFVARRIEAGRSPYELWSTTRVRNDSGRDATLRVVHRTYQYIDREVEEEGGGLGRISPAAAFGVCGLVEDTERFPTEELVKQAHGFGPAVSFAAVSNAYFVSAMAAAETGTAQRCVVNGERRGGNVDLDTWLGSLVSAELRFDRTTLGDGEESVTRALGYVGPSDREALRAAGHGLPEVVDLGWFSFIANGFNDLLGLIHGFVGNWGLAIILMTILVKLLFFPITMKSFRSMGRMRQLKPQIDALNEKYADDREKKGAAMMKLYRKEGVSPVSGCLPSLLQMPVWFALYRSLSTNIELYHAPFIVHWSDLSAPDPYFILPVLVGVMMHIQQRLTPNAMDSQQAKIMMWVMPIMIGGFMLFLPSGLCLYMVTNSTLTMIQQRAIYAKLDAEKAAKEESDPFAHGDEDDSDDSDDNDENEPGPSLESSSASATRRTLGSPKKKRQRRG